MEFSGLVDRNFGSCCVRRPLNDDQALGRQEGDKMTIEINLLCILLPRRKTAPKKKSS